MLGNTLAITERVLRQIRRDKRYVAMVLLIPLAVVGMLYIFFDSVEVPPWAPFHPQTFVIPVGAFLVHFLTYILSAIVLVRERSQETLGRMFINGYRRMEIIGGYVLAYSILATIQCLIVLIAIEAFFDLGYDLWTMIQIYVVIWLLAVLSVALGVFVSNMARNEGQVIPLIPPVIILSAFFSGMLVPVADLPNWISWLSVFTPMYYANNSIQYLIEASGAVTNVLSSAAVLPLYGVALLLLSTWTLREGN